MAGNKSFTETTMDNSGTFDATTVTALTMVHPTEWWLQSEEKGNNHNSYQSVDILMLHAAQKLKNYNSHHEKDEVPSNPLHDFLVLNNTYKATMNYPPKAAEYTPLSPSPKTQHHLTRR